MIRCGHAATDTRGETDVAAVDSGGDSTFATVVKTGRWPSPEVLDRVADVHEQQAATLRTAGDTSCNVHRPRLKEALQGQAGEAQFAAHNANVHLWDAHADLYKTSGDAVRLAAGELRSLQHDLRLLIEDKEPQYQAAMRSGKTVAAQAILTETLTEADDMVAKRGGSATMYVQGVNFTAPLPDRPATDPDGQNDHNGNPHHDKNTDLPVDGDTNTTPKGGDTGDAVTGQSQRDVETGLPADATTPLTQGPPRDVQTDLPPAGSANGGPAPATSPLTALPQALGGSMGRAASGGGGAGAGGGGSALSGLGSGLNPGSMGSGLGSSMPTSPASSLPSAPPAQSAASPLANAGSSFQSGLASGMGAAAPPPVAQQPIAQQALAAQQPLMGSAAGSGPAGVPIAPHGVPDGGGGGGPVQGGGSGVGPVGGAPMMPPAAMGGGGPLAPYSAPGAGAPPAGGGAPTTPAAGGQPSSGGAAPGGGSGLATGPVLAGGTGSGSAMGGMAASASEVSADMLLAQRVLGGLVRGCEFWPSPIAWAVGVVKTPVASQVVSQVVVASSVGGGSYLPATVFLPSTARLAVVDPALPFGWAQRWMGCQKPSKILVDHFERLSKRVAGASISAMVTTELWPVEPAGVGEFLGVQHRQALGMLSAAPTLDGAHQHRLTALDPVLAQRVSAIAANGQQVAIPAAAELTAAVIRAAMQPDQTGKPLAFQDEVDMLAAVSAGAADEAAWASYEANVAERDDKAWLWPESHAALDHDGSELSESMNLWYRHYFQGGRIVELVQWWKNSAAPLAEIAYCGVHAGFGAVVAATIGAMEEQLRRAGGPRP